MSFIIRQQYASRKRQKIDRLRLICRVLGVLVILGIIYALGNAYGQFYDLTMTR